MPRSRWWQTLIDGFLNILDSLVPGAKEAIMAVVGYFQGLLVTGISSALSFIEKRFPGLVSAMSTAARAVVNWAKWMVESVKTWINDNLGDAIAWARDRMRDLNALWNRIRRRQNELKGQKASSSCRGKRRGRLSESPNPAGHRRRSGR